MKRERALEIVKKHYSADVVDGPLSEALETLIPELAESEDEKIRKLILGKMKANRKYSNYWSDEEIAWVKKHKDSIPYEKYVYDIAVIHAEAKTKYHEGWNDGYEARQVINAVGDSGHQAGYAVAMNEMKPKVATATLDSEKQKEQKPADDIESAAYNYADNFAGDYDDAIYNDIVDAYKAGVYYMELKQKEQKPVEPSIDEPHWKPSEEQLNELHYALVPGYAYNGDVLQGLYADLKKLMEE